LHAEPRTPLPGAAAAVLMLAGTLAACVYLPRETSVYDADCRIASRQMTLEVTQVGAFGRCANEGCVAMLVAAGAVTAASAVVSGSIVVAGNVVYWFEKQGRCAR
jgi:hypothetical protein